MLDAKEKTAVEVAKIHATKLTIEDVMGRIAGRLAGGFGELPASRGEASARRLI